MASAWIIMRLFICSYMLGSITIKGSHSYLIVKEWGNDVDKSKNPTLRATAPALGHWPIIRPAVLTLDPLQFNPFSRP